IREFRDEAATVAEELGLTLIFDDGGWSDISQGFYSTKQASIIRVAVSFLAVIAAMGISVYLHIGRKKKDYAVMRSLGATKRSADAALMLPLMLVAAISVIAGSAVGLFYANASITARVTALELGEISAEIAMPAWASLCCIIGPIILVAAAALLILRRIGGSSALKLLNSE
ncbi:MAG: hypothetical protein FWH33_11510, partial [Oscillospiraceae bacterium]|nr:hypothetical protein [Oscillospiraceae bacterium]